MYHVAYRHRSLLARFLFLLLACGGSLLWAAEATTPVEQRLLHDIQYLASDAMEGRGLGTRGLDQAADFIRDQFKDAGLDVTKVDGGAFQKFSMTTGAKLGSPNRLQLTGPDGQKFDLQVDTDFIPLSFGGTGSFSAELVFCGYGIETADPVASNTPGKVADWIADTIEKATPGSAVGKIANSVVGKTADTNHKPAGDSGNPHGGHPHQSAEPDYNDFAGVDVKGKIVILMRRVPQQSNSQGPFAGPHGGISSHGALTSKVSNAYGHGAAAVIFVNDPHSVREELKKAEAQVGKLAKLVADAAVEFNALDPQDEKLAEARKKLTAEIARYTTAKSEATLQANDKLMKFGYGGEESLRSIPLMQITQAACNQVLEGALHKSLASIENAIDSDLKPRSAVLTGWKVTGEISIDRTTAEVKNVVGVLEGHGPHADETIVIGAHYDHVGRGGKGSLAPGSKEIHNGADDNASGTVSLIELARRLAARKDKLQRRIVFIAFTAEEVGLVGSARYTKNPVFPLDKTVAMLNMDMVGRLTDDKLTVFGTGTSPVWDDLVSRLSKDSQLQIISKPEGFGPSDHASFYTKQIPVLHFFTGTHSDYHRPSDDWEKINIPGMRRVVDLIGKIAWEIDQAPDRPAYVAVKGSASILRDGNRPYFGSIPDFGSEGVGYALSGVAPGSPAALGGLKGGDRIIQFGSQKIENLDDFDRALRKYTAGDTVEVTVQRGTETVRLKVTLSRPRG